MIDDVRAYHRAVVERLAGIFGSELIGVYAGGSFALSDFDLLLSDLDVTAVCVRRIDSRTKRAVVEGLRHESLPCPARGLELVVYRKEAVQTPSLDAAFELNLNTGERMPSRVDFEPGVERHWFAIDRSILRDHGVPLAGPPARALFAPIPRKLILAALTESIRWHKGAEGQWSNAVLNACRALRFAEEGIWSSKQEAAVWALRRHEDGVISQALAARGDEAKIRPAGVGAFLDAAETAVQAAAREGGGRPRSTGSGRRPLANRRDRVAEPRELRRLGVAAGADRR